MKFLTCISLCILVVAALVNVAQAAEIKGRGMATVMSFANSTSTDLEKRSGRGTW
jgi:hypothetical protein